MSKYGDLNNLGTIDNTDVNILWDHLTGKSPITKNSNAFFAANMSKKWTYSGPAFFELLKLNKVISNDLSEEDFYEADYNDSGGTSMWDNPESGKGAYVDLDETKFVATFPGLIDFASWSGSEEITGTDPDFRETGGARIYKKNGAYGADKDILPPTELYKTKTFEKSEFGLRSTALAGDYMATSAYLYGADLTNTPTIASVYVYKKVPDGEYTFRHEIEVTATRAPIVEIKGTTLFVGNPSNHEVLIYDLNELDSNHQYYSKNNTSPKQTLTPSQVGTQSTDFYGSYLHCSDGEHLFVGTINGRIQQTTTLTEETYQVDCGYVDVYKLSTNGVWEYFTKIVPNDIQSYPASDSYGYDYTEMQFGYSVFHKKTSTAEFVVIGAPKASQAQYLTSESPLFPGAVYIFEVNRDSGGLQPIDSFDHVYTQHYKLWYEGGGDETLEYEFGRSAVLDDALNLWVASNPPAGSHVTRFAKKSSIIGEHIWDDTDQQGDEVVTGSPTWQKISQDRLGGVVSTNGDDIVYGGPFKIRIFQKETIENPVDNLSQTDNESPSSPEEPPVQEVSPNAQVITESNEPTINKEFPSLWGSAPVDTSTNLIELPFGYGTGSQTLVDWILENSTGDMRSTRYLRHVDDQRSSTDEIDYNELWNHGNPTIQVMITSGIGGVIKATTPHGGIMVEENKMLRYKSVTRSTIVLQTASNLKGVSVYWIVNGKRMIGNTKLELMVCGEDMKVEVIFSREKFAENDTPTMAAYTRAGETKIIDKRTLYST